MPDDVTSIDAQSGRTAPLPDLTGKSAVVTGAAGGIGRQVAKDLAEAGARVVAVDMEAGKCAETCIAFPERMSSLAVDVTSVANIEAGLKAAWQDHGRLDILVNCAGVYSMQPMLSITEAEYDRVLSINLKGSLFFGQAAARYMIETGQGGAIVNVASAAGRRPSMGSLAYSASKAAVINMTQGMALELGRHRIRVNAIAPGAVETPMFEEVRVAYGAQQTDSLAPTIEAALLSATPLGRLSQPQDCADAIIYLCGPQSAFVTGQTLNVDGGMYFN